MSLLYGPLEGKGTWDPKLPTRFKAPTRGEQDNIVDELYYEDTNQDVIGRGVPDVEGDLRDLAAQYHENSARMLNAE